MLPPALAALCLGLVGHRRMPAQFARNQAFSHAGAFSAAILIGAGSRFCGYGWIFYLFAPLPPAWWRPSSVSAPATSIIAWRAARTGVSREPTKAGR